MAKQRRPDLKKIADDYEGLCDNGLLEFVAVTPEMRAKFPEWTRKYLDFFDAAGIKYKVCRQCIGGSLVFETDDPVIAYFHHVPAAGVHQWVGPGFHETLDSNDAISYLATRRGGDRDLNKKILDFVDQIVKTQGEPDPEAN